MKLDFSKKILLENDSVRLEPLKKSKHFDALLALSEEDPTLLKYSPSPFGTPELMRKYFKIYKKDHTAKTRYAFAIFDKKTQQYAGSTSCGNVSNLNQKFEIGWTWLAKAFQGTGLNKNCKYLLLQFAFEVLQFERVELKTDERNEQSKAAIKKIGATYEGTLRRNTLMPDGFWRSTSYYSILRSEWEGVKDNIFMDLK